MENEGWLRGENQEPRRGSPEPWGIILWVAVRQSPEWKTSNICPGEFSIFYWSVLLWPPTDSRCDYPMLLHHCMLGVCVWLITCLLRQLFPRHQVGGYSLLTAVFILRIVLEELYVRNYTWEASSIPGPNLNDNFLDLMQIPYGMILLETFRGNEGIFHVGEMWTICGQNMYCGDFKIFPHIFFLIHLSSRDGLISLPVTSF